MVTQLCIDHGHSCLTSMIWPFTLTALTFGSCFFVQIGVGDPITTNFAKKFTAHPSLKGPNLHKRSMSRVLGRVSLLK